MPIACSGLLNTDGGVFGTYVKKFIQNAFTVLVQVVLIKLSIGLLMSDNLILGLATAFLAIKTPRFLTEFMLTSNGNGLNMYHVSQGAHFIKSLVTKT